MSKKTSDKKKRYQSPLIEVLEPRFMMSADLPIDILVNTDDQQDLVAESQSILESAQAHYESLDAQDLATTDSGIDLTRHELIIIDPSVADYQLLIDDILAQSDDATRFSVLLLNANEDGLAQITDALSDQTGLDAMHFISHGSAAEVHIGQSTLDLSSTQDHAQTISAWSSALDEKADILIYGCNLTSTSEGELLVDTIAFLTGADVAASDDLTGHESLSGDWDLEYEVGAIETQVALTEDVQATWTNILAPDGPSDLSTGIAINTEGGNDVYLEANNGDAILGGLTEVTFEVSFQIDNPQPDNNTILSYSSGLQHNAMYLTIYADGELRLGINSLGLGELTSVGTYAELLDGELHHLATTWDGTTGEVIFYIDGVQAEPPQTYQSGTSIATGGTLQFGQDQDLTGYEADQGFSGTFFDIRIWDHVRNASEIGSDYEHQYDSSNIPSGLIANWQMQSLDGGTTIADVVNPGTQDLPVGHVGAVSGFTTGTATASLSISEDAVDGSH